MDAVELRNRLLRAILEPALVGQEPQARLVEVDGDTAWLTVRRGAAWLALVALADGAESDPGMAWLRARVKAVLDEVADGDLYVAVTGGGPTVRRLLQSAVPLLRLRRRIHLHHIDERLDSHRISGEPLPVLERAARFVRLAPPEEPVAPLSPSEMEVLTAVGAGAAPATAPRRRLGAWPVAAIALSVAALSIGAARLLRPAAPAARPVATAVAAPADGDATACEHDARACRRAGLALGDGKHGPPDLHDAERARAFWARGCDGGDAESCALLGYACSHGEGGPRDDGLAIELYGRACDGGDAHGCANLGVMYENGAGAAKDLARAAAAFRQGCEGGDADACYGLGLHLAEGSGVPSRDLPGAARRFTEACDGGGARGCYAAGLLYQTGEGVEKDLARAALLEERACRGELWKACAVLGEMYRGGEGVATDEARARELLEKACRGGIAGACSR